MKQKIITSVSVTLAALACQTSADASTSDAASDMVLAILSGTVPAAEEPAPAPADAQPAAEEPAPAPADAQPAAEEPAPAPADAQPAAEEPAPAPADAQPAAEEPAPAPADALPAATTSERILTKPGSILYAAASEDAKAAGTYLPDYTIARTLKAEGEWIEIQLANNETGWIKGSDILPWKHQLVIQFAAPTGRQRTLFFADKETALRYADMTDEERQEALAPVYEAIAAGKPITDKGIVACEPDGWATMDSNFYLMPITEFEAEQSEIAADLGIQAIKVSAVTENAHISTASVVNDTTGITMDIVFVMDLSRSMRPIKEQVLKTINSINDAVSKNPSFNKDMIHFGFWGYRDSTDACKGIEYVTRDYTANGLVSTEEFPEILKQAEATPVDSVDYAEDVLAGVSDAINHTKWRDGAARVIILIGDAPGREPGKTDPFSARKDKPVGTAANMGVAEIATLANQNRVAVGTAYINVARYKEHLPIARKQFEALATGDTEKATAVINVAKAGEFESFVSDMITWLVAQTKLASENRSELKTVTRSQKFASALFNNAKVRWLSEAHEVGVTPDMNGWILDKDLSDSALDAVKPCVLLNRQQLDTMKSLMETVVAAGEKAQGTSSELLTALKAVVVAGAKDPAMLENIRLLADSEFIPTFLKDLPYQSRIMTLSNEYWQAMNRDEQDDMLTLSRNKIQFYEDVYKNQDLWMRLDENDSDDQKVVPIPFDMLP